MSENLWPEDLIENSEPDLELDSPLQILREQARLLEERTSDKVKADVEIGSLGDKVLLTFVLLAPVLGDYRYTLFRVVQPLDYYPVRLLGSEQEWDGLDRAQFPQALREIFSSTSTRRAVQELLAYSTDVGGRFQRVA